MKMIAVISKSADQFFTWAREKDPKCNCYFNQQRVEFSDGQTAVRVRETHNVKGREFSDLVELHPGDPDLIRDIRTRMR